MVNRLECGHMDLHVTIKRLDPSLPLPVYKTAGAAGFDIAVREALTLQPGERRIIPTGLVVCVPAGYVLLVFPRSSSAKKGITLANGVGVIDEDYCGPEDELKLPIYNIGAEAYVVERGERLAQGVFVPIARAQFVETESLESPSRGGFGSTGLI